MEVNPHIASVWGTNKRKARRISRGEMAAAAVDD